MSDYSVSVYERSGSPYWWARCYLVGEGGKDRRWSTGVRVDEHGGRRQSRRVAQARADERAADLAAGVEQVKAASSSVSLGSVAERMLAQKRADGKRHRTLHSLAHLLDKHVKPALGGVARDVTTIRRADLEALKRKLAEDGHAPVTINNVLTAARAVLKYAHAVEELIDSVPDVRNVRVPAHSSGRALEPHEVAALIDAIDPRSVEAKQWLLFVANTGLRKGECSSMRWGWVHWDARELHVPASYNKTGKDKIVPLNAVAFALLEERRDHGTKYTGTRKDPLPTGDDDRVWLQRKHDVARNSAAERAGLGHVRSHDLRHTFGSLAYAAGASLPEVRDLLGHSTMAMVNRYAHSYRDRLRDAASRVTVGNVDAVRNVRVNVPGDETPRVGIVPDRAQRDDDDGE